jgi:hypothetical protein
MPENTALQRALVLTINGLHDLIPDTDLVEEIGDDVSCEHLHWMLNECLANVTVWPEDKTSRWIGYVQGVSTFRGFISTKAERDRTRPFFHEAYRNMGVTVPKTTDRAVEVNDNQPAYYPRCKITR